MNSIVETNREPSRRQSIDWGMVAAFLTIVGWLLMGASGVFGDYRKIGDRVLTLETQRQSDVERQTRIEGKVDRILERVQK